MADSVSAVSLNSGEGGKGIPDSPGDKVVISVGLGTCGRAAGALEVYAALGGLLDKRGLGGLFSLARTGCCGACWAEPIVSVRSRDGGWVSYGKVEPKDCGALLDCVCAGKVFSRRFAGVLDDCWHPLLSRDHVIGTAYRQDGPLTAFFSRQTKIVSAEWGRIDPYSLDDYCGVGGFRALGKVFSRQRTDLLRDIELSGLRGRGGAGFPTGKKLRIAMESTEGMADGRGSARYVIANADEGDPGAYMDRALMESNPFQLIEGIAIASYIIDAREAFIFVRAEYAQAVDTLNAAIVKAQDAGMLTSPDGSWGLSLRTVVNPGAFVCGEETSMVKVLEGKPGFPSLKPPYPAQKGLWGKPTFISNVETLANLPYIAMHGPSWFRSFGTMEGSGTKLFSVTGALERPGLVEVPLGSSVAAVLDIAGACLEEADAPLGGSEANVVRAIQLGGPSGSFLPRRLFDMRLDFENLAEKNLPMGSGGLVAFDGNQCIVDTVRYLAEFMRDESCGVCGSCRPILAQIERDLGAVCRGEKRDLSAIALLCQQASRESRCGLGRMSGRAVETAIEYFAEEFEAHMNGACPGRRCRGLIHFEVIAQKCPGCRCCLSTCPTNAMRGDFGKPYVIRQDLCVKCWMCTDMCPYDAVLAFSTRCKE